MRNEQASIGRAGILNVLCVFPESSEMETLIACAVLAPWIRTIVSDVGWDITAVDTHDVYASTSSASKSFWKVL